MEKLYSSERETKMDYAKPNQIRKKLTTESAKQAFDRINALGPYWVEIIEGPEKVYLSPTLETKKVGGSILHSIGNGWAESLDQAVENQWEALVQAASEENTIVVANAYKEDRTEFTFDKEANCFSPV